MDKINTINQINNKSQFNSQSALFNSKFFNLSAVEVIEKIKTREFTCREICEYYLNRMKELWDKNAILEIFDDALQQADNIDLMIANYYKNANPETTLSSLPKLCGLPIVIKDNILYKGKTCSCGSQFMKNYKAQYNATVIEKLLKEGVVILARANMDEFAMGGSCENSAFGACKNAFDDSRVSGGSSGGSAVAVACDMCAVALGSDTGGSIRQPSAFNGLVGIKPTFGRVSRYGLVAYVSSFDQISPIAKNVEDSALILSVIAGKDINDETSLSTNEITTSNIKNLISNIDEKIFIDNENSINIIKQAVELSKKAVNLNGLKIGILKETQKLMQKTEYNDQYNRISQWLQNQGATLKEFSVPYFDLALPTYYTLASAEASSNLGRFDGVKYTTRSEKASNIPTASLDDVYLYSRSEGFGKEVQRRIMLGNFVLSSGYYDAYYMKALKIRRDLKNQFNEIFENCDVIIFPTAYGEAFEIGEKTTNPVEMYVEDMFTTMANILGIPAISIPCGLGKNNLPLGLQILAKANNEPVLYYLSNYMTKNYEQSKNSLATTLLNLNKTNQEKIQKEDSLC